MPSVSPPSVPAAARRPSSPRRSRIAPRRMNFLRSSMSMDAIGLGREGLQRGLDAVEPHFADAVPARFLGIPALHPAEAQAAHARHLPHDVGMRPAPVREELLLAHARLAADEADALDHAALLLWRALEQFERDAVVDAQIGGPGALVRAAVDRRPGRPARSAARRRPPRGARRLSASSTARQRWHIAGIGGRLGVRRPCPVDLVVEQLETYCRPAGRRRRRGSRCRDSRRRGRDRAGRAPSASAPASPRNASQKASAASRSATLMPTWWTPGGDRRRAGHRAAASDAEHAFGIAREHRRSARRAKSPK